MQNKIKKLKEEFNGIDKIVKKKYNFKDFSLYMEIICFIMKYSFLLFLITYIISLIGQDIRLDNSIFFERIAYYSIIIYMIAFIIVVLIAMINYNINKDYINEIKIVRKYYRDIIKKEKENYNIKLNNIYNNIIRVN